jgi:hypothetical protein
MTTTTPSNAQAVSFSTINEGFQSIIDASGRLANEFDKFQSLPAVDNGTTILAALHRIENTMNLRFDQLDVRVDGLERRLDGMERRLDGMEQRQLASYVQVTQIF